LVKAISFKNKMDIEKITLFDNYIKEQLTEEEKVEFDKKLESDNAFAKEFTVYVNLVEGVNQYEREKLKHQMKNSGKHVKYKLIRVYLSVAAILLILLIPAYFVYYSNVLPNSLYKNYRISEKDLGFELGASANTELRDAIDEYLNGNVNVSLKKLNDIELKNTQNDTVNYYIGACYLELNEHKKALLYFSKLSNSTTNYFAVAKYNMALIYIKQNNFMDARSELNAIPKKGVENTIGKKANLLMQEIQ
jgi:hypothetical protein